MARKLESGSLVNNPCPGMSRIWCAIFEGDSTGVRSRGDCRRARVGVTPFAGLLELIAALSGESFARMSGGGGKDRFKTAASDLALAKTPFFAGECVG
jgi:hypothetical protein